MGGRTDANEIEKRRREKDAAAREKRHRYFKWWHTPSDRFAFLVAIFTGVLAVFTGVLAVVSIFQWLKLSDQQQAMHGQLDVMTADERPWIAIENLKLAGPLTHDAAGWQGGTRWHVMLSYHLKNYGKTPATHVVFWAHLVPIVGHYPGSDGKMHGDFIGDDLNSACNLPEFSTDYAMDTGREIFPDQERQPEFFDAFGDENVFTAAKSAPPPMYSGIFLVAICVTYRSAYSNIHSIGEILSGIPADQPSPVFGNDKYRTAEGWRLGKPSGGRIDLNGETVSQTDLILAAPGFQATEIK